MKRLRFLILAAALFVSSILVAGEPAPASELARTIDASQYFRPFPKLPNGRNTSLQKAPAPVLAELSEREFGRPRITKCWLNLDEMWDYRTREYDLNFRIGVHKYDGIPEKHGETWGSEVETNIHFEDYLKAFGEHSDEIMLTIRRYERDILDGKLGVTMADWREIFKNAVVHYRRVCPNLRYIEVCNEYALKGFIGCTAEEYYRFYQAAYQAVNEANLEMGLAGRDRILVGGPAVTGDIVGKMDLFFENFSKDTSPDKTLDFVSWHEYGKSYRSTALREGEVQHHLARHGLPRQLPMFVTEHDPYHGKLGTHELNLVNGAGLVKSLYFAGVYSPGIVLLPWVQYHVAEIQTQFMWFAGPNEPDTKAEELRLLPSGCSMKLLSMHRDWEIAVDNGLERDELVLASVQAGGLAVHAVNYGEARPVRIEVGYLPKVFTVLGSGKLRFTQYLIDEHHSNAVTDPAYPGGIQKIDEGVLAPENGAVVLAHPELGKNGIVFWLLEPEKVGTPLNDPVPQPSPPAPAEKNVARFQSETALSSAKADPGASIERAGDGFSVQVGKSEGRPGITFAPASGAWSLAGYQRLEATVKNTGKHNLGIHLAIDGPDADRTHRKNCAIASESIAPGGEKTLSIPVPPALPAPVKWLWENPGKAHPFTDSEPANGSTPRDVKAISLYIYHPGGEHTFEVTSLRGVPADPEN